MSMTPDEQRKYDHESLEFLYEVGRELTADARDGKFNPVIGRKEEIRMMVETLCRSTKSNPVLVGPAGVGKTALAEGLAIKIAEDDIPDKLRGCRLFLVSMSSLIAGCNWYGMIETRVKNLLAEARKEKVIIFIDEIHTIVGTAPDGDSSRDVGQQLKPALARGEIKLIGATTDDEYRRFIEQDEALERRFQPVRVSELTTDQTFVILKKKAEKLSKESGIEVRDNILRLVLSYGERFMPNRHFPDKAIDLLEQTVAFVESEQRKTISAKDAKQITQRMVGMPVQLNDSLERLAEKIIRHLS